MSSSRAGHVVGHGAIERHAGFFLGVAAGHFHLAGVEVALAEAEAYRHADHFVFGKFEAGAVLVVVVDFDPKCPLARRGGNFIGGLSRVRATGLGMGTITT
jgi:hypothetical protein